MEGNMNKKQLLLAILFVASIIASSCAHAPAVPTATATGEPSPTESIATETIEPAAICGNVVVAASGDSIQGAYVAIIDVQSKIEQWEETASTSTDDHGQYRFTDVPKGDYYLIAYAEGYAREIYNQALVIQEAEIIHYEGVPLMGIDFALNESGSISGRVTAADGTTPIPDITVTVSPAKYMWVDVLWFKTRSDANGYFQIKNLPLGDYGVFIEEAGYQNEFYNNFNYLSLFTPVDVQPPLNTGGIDMALDLEGQIHGRVIDDQTGEPIENVFIHIEPVGPGTAPTWGLMANSDANGEFTAGMLQKATFMISARVEGYGDEIYNHQSGWLQADLMDVPYGQQISGITVRMRRCGMIRGHLYDEDGKPLPGMFLDVRTLADDHASAMPTYATDTDGSYSVCMPTGTYAMLADFVPGYVEEYYDDVYNIEDATPVQVVEGGKIDGIDFYLQLEGTISGSVYHPDGKTPVPEAEIFAFPISGKYGAGAISDSDGYYHIEGLPAGAYTIRVKVPGIDEAIFYPGLTNEADASQVEVFPPADTKDIIIILP
jgi:protocatechuate 3,4-dioxygenase beta subunit